MKGFGRARDSVAGIRIALNKGYVIVPSGVDREDYIETCLRKHRLSIVVESGGGVVHDCVVSEQVIRDINFPDNPITDSAENNSLGSGVVFFQEPYSGLVVIIATVKLQSETSYERENVFRIDQSSKKKSATVEVDGKTGNINVNSEGGSINISIKNGDTSSLDVFVSGLVNVYAQDNISIKGMNNYVLDVRETITNLCSKFEIGDGSHPIPHGDELKEQLNKLKDKVDGIENVLRNTISSVSNSPNPSWSGIITPIADSWPDADFSNIESDKSFTE